MPKKPKNSDKEVGDNEASEDAEYTPYNDDEQEVASDEDELDFDEE